MSYSIQPLPNKRWGIYTQDKLLATYGCHHTCSIVLEQLQMRNKTSFKTYQHPVSLFKQAA